MKKYIFIAANRTNRVVKKRKIYNQFSFSSITLSKKLNSTKITNNKSYKLKDPKTANNGKRVYNTGVSDGANGTNVF